MVKSINRVIRKVGQSKWWPWAESFLAVILLIILWAAIYSFLWTSDRHYPG